MKTIYADNFNIRDLIQLHAFTRKEKDLNFIDVSKVTNMENLFEDLDYSPDISQWDVSKVTNMNSMFFGSDFNGDISQWDVSNVIDMYGMFYQSKYTHKILSWRINLNCPINSNKNIFNKTHIILQNI